MCTTNSEPPPKLPSQQSKRKTYEQLRQQVLKLKQENTALQRKIETRQSLKDKSGRFVGTMNVGEDAAEQVRFDQLKDDFVSMVSHELRTPLTAIHGGVKLLSQGFISSDSERGRQLLDVVAQNSQRLVRLVNDILDIEYFALAKNPLQKQLTNTHEITYSVAKMFELTATNADIDLTVCDPGLEVACDRDRLIQVLTNLVDNAIKFSPPNASVIISVEPMT